MSERSKIPEGWVQTTLGTICSRPQYGWTTKADSRNGLVRLLRTTDISGGFINWDTVPYCTEIPESLDAYRLAEGDIVISRAGSVGVSYLLSYVPSETVFASYLIRFRPCEEIDPQYIAYYLQTAKYWASIHEQSVGIALANVNARKLEAIEIPLCPPSEQHRIVAAIEQQFSRLDAGVAALRRAQAKLKRYRAAVLKAAVEGNLTEVWRAEHPTTEPASNLLERILAERRAKWEADLRAKGKDPAKVRYVEPAKPDTESLPELPEGWCYTLIAPLLSVIRKGMTTGPFGSLLKKHEHRSDGIPVLGIENIAAMKFVVGSKIYISGDKARQISQYDAQPGDVLISRSGTVGEVCVVPDHLGEVRISTNLMRVAFAWNGMFPQFFCLLFNGSPFVLSQVSELCRGSTRDFLSQAILSSIVFPLPPLAEQQQIVAEVEQRLSVVIQLEATVAANLKRAERLRQSILKEAFAGRLVPQDPSDEPANILLERIRKERDQRKNGAVNKGHVVSVAVDEPVKIDVGVTRQVELWEGVGG